MTRLQKYAPLLLAVQAADPKTRVAIVRTAPPDFIKSVIEIVLNFLRGNIPTTTGTLKRLRHRKSILRKVAMCRGDKGVRYVRKTLISQKGGLLPLLIPLIAGLGLGGAAAAAIPAIARKSAKSAAEGALDTLEERAKKLIN